MKELLLIAISDIMGEFEILQEMRSLRESRKKKISIQVKIKKEIMNIKVDGRK